MKISLFGFLIAATMVSTLGAVPFYNGTTAGWATSGGGAIVSIATLGGASGTTLTPTSNPRFVLVSNGPGSDFTTATFSNSFSIGVGGGSIAFTYWFVTNELTGSAAGSPGIDSYSILITGPTALMNAGDVSEAGFACFDGSDCFVTATVPLASSFLEFASYKKYVRNATALAQGNYSIAFTVSDDAGDAGFDSGLLLDSIVVTNNTTSGVPEPATMWLAASGLVVLLWRRR